MKRLQEWFHEDGGSQEHLLKKLFHWFCIPTLVFSLLRLLKTLVVCLTLWLARVAASLLNHAFVT